MKLSNLRLGFELRSLALAAALAAVCLVVGAPEAFAAVSYAAAHAAAAGSAHHDLFSHVLGASLSVAALRTKVGELETRATAKEAELRDGLTPEQIRAVETDHGTIMGELEAARRDLAVAEEAERSAAASAAASGAGGGQPGNAPTGGPDLDLIRAQERVAERKRAADIRVTARKLGLPDEVAEKAVNDGVALDAFRGWAIDEAHKRQAPATWNTPPVGENGGSHRSFAQPAAKVAPGTDAVRCMIALAATRGDPRHAAAFVTEHYGRGGDIAARALAASIGSSGEFLIPADMASEVIELLRPASAVMALGPEIVPMPRGQMLLPKQTSGSQASYVGENMPAPASQPGFGGVQLTARKLVALVPISNDMIRFAGPQVDGLVRGDMVRAIAQRTDGAFLRGNGGQSSPRGFRSFAAAPAIAAQNFLTATSPITLQNVVNDLGRLELALEQANIVMERPGWVMAPRTKTYLKNLRDGLGNAIYEKEMNGGMLRGKPFRVTTQIPVNLAAVDDTGRPTTDGTEIYLADFAQVVVGEVEGLEIATFEGAAYVDGNGQLQSGVSNDQTVMRAIVQHDLGLRHDEAVAVLTGVRWKS